VRILMIGDIVGRPGRIAVLNLVPGLRQKYEIDFVIANGENTAGGKGLTITTAEELLSCGIDVLTSGNHIWAQKEIITYIDDEPRILRPLNYPPGTPGHGYFIDDQVMVVNLMGRTYISNVDCPFRAMDRLLKTVKKKPPVILVDFHAEATSEKNALGRYLDGRVSAVVGTHTHIGTVDTRIFPNGTAFVTDIGMVGPSNSIIGDEIELVLRRFLTQMPQRLSVANGPVNFNSVLVDVESSTGMAIGISRLDREVD